MKLNIKADDKRLKVNGRGATKDLFATLLAATWQIMKTTAKNEQGFENAKRILSSGIKATNYDGTTDNELYQRLINDEH